MAQMQFTRTVAAPLASTFAYFTHFERYPEFMAAVEHVARREHNPTRYAWLFTLGTIMREHDTTIEVDHAAHTVQWYATSGADHTGHAALSATEHDETELALTVAFYPQGLVEHLGDTLGLLRTRINHDLGRFAEYVESEGRRAPTGRRVPASGIPDTRGPAPSQRLTELLFDEHTV